MFIVCFISPCSFV